MVSILIDGLVEPDVIVQLARAVPAAGHAPTVEGTRAGHFALCPEHLAVVVVDAVVEVEDELLCLALGEDVAVDAAAGGGGELAADAVVVEEDGVVARLGMLRLVAEALAIATVGVVGGTGVEARLTRVGHDEEVAEVAVARAAEVGVGKTYDAAVAVLVAGAVVVYAGLVDPIDVVRDGVGVGTQLDEAVGVAGPREGVAHAVGAYHRVDVPALTHGCGYHHAKPYQDALFHEERVLFRRCKDTKNFPHGQNLGAWTIKKGLER